MHNQEEVSGDVLISSGTAEAFVKAQLAVFGAGRDSAPATAVLRHYSRAATGGAVLFNASALSLALWTSTGDRKEPLLGHDPARSSTFGADDRRNSGGRSGSIASRTRCVGHHVKLDSGARFRILVGNSDINL